MAVPRKMLVLDLNGTLLVRGSHAKRKQPMQSLTPPGDLQAQVPRLRAVHSRPFLPSFREYLFHTETKKWLDTMVWSSAQPHSVADMVQHCFGETKEELLTIWARDTLGLSERAYNRKTSTTKDLAKVWSAFPTHSTKTTLLLDDSILKAQLQPWNHLCVPEYITALRVKDLKVLKSSTADRIGSQPLVKMCTIPNTSLLSSALSKTTTAATKTLGSSNGKSELEENLLEGATDQKYDEALLAVIGILDALKDESDVGKWIRSGGLYSKSPLPDLIVRDSGETDDSTTLQKSGDALSLQELDDVISSIGTGTPKRVVSNAWFEHDNLIDVWASNGRKVLNVLGIGVVSGVIA